MINSLEAINATTRYNLLERLDGLKKGTAVCHGDFNPSNVIVSEDGTLSVCDWAPAADVAMTYLLFSLTSKEQAEAYLDTYCERADMAKQIVRQWLPVIAASELARKRKVNEEFLMSWVDVFDYQ